MTPTDMRQVMSFNRPGFCNNGSYDIIKDDLLLHVKNPLGYPIDMRRMVKLTDKITGKVEDWITDQQTEVNWEDPGFIKLHLGNDGVGNRMCPRYISTFPYTVSEIHSPLRIIKDGKMDYAIKDAGPVQYYWHPPIMKDWGGDIKAVLSYLVDYYWSGGKSNREQYWFSPGWGLIKWNHGKLVGKDYVLDNDPPANNRLMSLKQWQTKLPIKEFTYVMPYFSEIPLLGQY